MDIEFDSWAHLSDCKAVLQIRESKKKILAKLQRIFLPKKSCYLALRNVRIWDLRSGKNFSPIWIQGSKSTGSRILKTVLKLPVILREFITSGPAITGEM